MTWLIPVLTVASLAVFTLDTIIFFNPENISLQNYSRLINNTFMSLIPYMLTVAIGSMLALKLRLLRPPIALLCLAELFLIEKYNILESSSQINGIQFFIGLTAPFLVVNITAFFYKKRWFEITDYNITGTNIKDTINLVIPGGIGLISTAFIYIPLITLFNSYSGTIIELDPVESPYETSTTIAFLNSALWFIGIHGYYALMPLFNQLSITELNFGAINSQFLGSFVFIGGAGSTLSLIIPTLILSKNLFHKKISLISIPLAIFGINEILLFCLPIILNFRLLIPFILVPISNALIATWVLQSEWIQLTPGSSLINTPIFFNAWITTGGDMRGVLLQIFCIFMGSLIYAPFVILSNKYRNIKKETTPQLKDTFSEAIEEFTSESDDPIHFLILQNKKIEKLQDSLSLISNSTFQIHYQPKIAPKTHLVTGCEALIRAKGEDNDTIPPSNFIPYFIETDTIHHLDVWVASEVVRQIKAWKKNKLPLVQISINISPNTLSNTNAIDKILNIITPYKEYIRIEMTEETLAKFDERLNLIVNKIHKSEIPLDIDDFGTGYSSLSYLSKIEFSSIKVDRSFVSNIEDKKGRLLLHAIIQFSQQLQKPIIIEGIETAQQLKEVKNYDNLSIQGWFYAKAMDADSLQDYIQAHNGSKEPYL
jgi:EAL domain-containing protein (putative c-di-GMP-specific phosphodiesterase class I)/cellobiose-specific phosphotransferase system component IIC